MESHHEYRIKAFGAGGRNGVIQAEGVLSSISFSAPPEFSGEPGRWTPEVDNNSLRIRLAGAQCSGQRS